MTINPDQKFFSLLGWSDSEMTLFAPQWRTIREFLGLTDEDMDQAVNSWLPNYWDFSFRGIQKCFTAYIKELAEIVKLREYKERGDQILYANMPASPVCIYANKLAGGDTIHVSHPDFIISTVLRAFFHKDMGDSEAAFDSKCHHCLINCARAVGSFTGMIPKPSVTWNWWLHCDEGPKTEEFISCLTGEQRSNVFTALPHDATKGEFEWEDSNRIKYLANEIRIGQDEITKITGIPVEEKHLQTAMDEYLAYMSRLEKLTVLVSNADPQPITGNALTLFGACMSVIFDSGLATLNDALDTMLDEVKECISKNKGVLPKGAPKLACHFTPLNVPWMDKAFRENGVNLTFSTIFAPASVLEQCTGDNSYETIAKQCLVSPSSVNMSGEARLVENMIENYHVDGMLYGFFAFDRWIGGIQKTLVRILEEETGIPHFYLEGDFWDESRYTIEDRISRIRSICNCLKISQLTNIYGETDKQCHE